MASPPKLEPLASPLALLAAGLLFAGCTGVKTGSGSTGDTGTAPKTSGITGTTSTALLTGRWIGTCSGQSTTTSTYTLGGPGSGGVGVNYVVTPFAVGLDLDVTGGAVVVGTLGYTYRLGADTGWDASGTLPIDGTFDGVDLDLATSQTPSTSTGAPAPGVVTLHLTLTGDTLSGLLQSSDASFPDPTCALTRA